MIGIISAICILGILTLRIVHHINLLSHVRARGLSLNRIVLGYSSFLTIVRAVLLILVSLLISGMYEAIWSRAVFQERTIERRDCIIAIDVSQSMRARDGGISRLDRAKKKVAELLAARAADRYALYVFAGDAVLLAPLTADIGCVELFLNDIDDRMIAASTTSLAALLKAVLEHDASDTLAAQRTVVVLSDGEDFSENLAESIHQASQRGIRVVSWAIGSETGSPIPLYDERGAVKGHLKAPDGTVVISRREDGALADLAEKTGGFFVVQTADSHDSERVIAALIPQKATDREKTTVLKVPAHRIWATCVLAALEWMIAA